MKYVVMSDTHDNMQSLDKALEIIESKNIVNCFHLGDFCAPGTIRKLTTNKNLKWTCVWGNVDGAKAKILLEQKENKNFDISDEHFREIEINEFKIFLVHFQMLAKHAALTGKYKAVFYGDTHLKTVEILRNGTLLANPGEVCGIKTGGGSIGVWDSESNDFELIDL